MLIFYSSAWHQSHTLFFLNRPTGSHRPVASNGHWRGNNVEVAPREAERWRQVFTLAKKMKRYQEVRPRKSRPEGVSLSLLECASCSLRCKQRRGKATHKHIHTCTRTNLHTLIIAPSLIARINFPFQRSFCLPTLCTKSSPLSQVVLGFLKL